VSLPTPPMRQEAPYPTILADLVGQLRYKPGWRFHLQHLDRGQGSTGLTLSIYVKGPDSYAPDTTIEVVHYMPVPPAAFNRRSWQRWLLEQILLVEQHEACEFFRLEQELPNRIGTELLGPRREEHRPYAPLHGPGNSPYLIAELATDEERRTDFRGTLQPGRP
jgi:hypothetical protein